MRTNNIQKTIRQRWRIVFLCLFLAPQFVFSQQYYFEQYSVSEGLAQSSAYTVIQDNNDIFWIGTQAGVSTFDGLRFVNFTAEHGLYEGGVRSVYQDSYGNIWFGHIGGGISRYADGIFEKYEDSELFFKSTITSIIEDTNRQLWITSEESGAARIYNPGSAIDSLKYELFLGRRLSDRVFGSSVGPEGSLYFVTDLVVKKWNPDSLGFDNLILKGVSNYAITTCVIEDSHGNIWSGKYNNGLYKYDPEVNDSYMIDLIKAGMSSNWISTLFEDSEGNIWVGTWGGGVACIDRNDELMIYNSQNGMSGSKIWMIMEDKEGNIIFGTNEHGLCVYKGDQFLSFSEIDGLTDDHVWAIEQADNGSMWIGTNHGISIIKLAGSEPLVRDFNKLTDRRVRFIEKDLQGKMWIGVQDEGIFVSDERGNLNYIPQLNMNVSLGTVTGMAIDKQNNLWAGTLDGLIYFEINNYSVDKLTQSRGLKGNVVSSVFADSKDRIWIGIEGKGITLIDGTDFSNPVENLSITPTCFAEDMDGNIWFGTRGRGAYAVDADNFEIINHLTTGEGLQANLVNLINSDTDNNIYIGTNKGLNKYQQKDGKLKTFIQKSGFPGIETKQNATCVDKDGYLWFGSDHGATKMNPSFEPKSIVPLTHITGLMVNYEAVKPVDNMKLSYRENSLIFDYSSISLNPDAMVYQIMLEGIDKDWRNTNQLQVTYPALPPGKYSFLVKARNAEGIWNDPPISFSFTINPPFYLTWYFILSMVVLIAILVFIYIKVREQALVRENRVLESKVKERTAVVVAQKEELAQKNKDITDSINYARRIQFAILPPESPFPDTFILFKPKDIVSGDFYWFSEAGGKEFIAAVDCTGHGVPGALMSMIGHGALNKIVNQYGIYDPGKILNELNKEVVDTLHHSRGQTDVMDGMDLALIAYDREHSKLEYSGAYNPLYLIREGELLETKADKQAIGRTQGIEKKEFTTHSVELQKGDTIYLFSDGYADQFGGESMKKFKPGNLRKLFLAIYKKAIEEQREILNNTIEEWRGEIQQVDDILIIGRRF